MAAEPYWWSGKETTTVNKTTIIVADDHPVFLEGLKKVLAAQADFEVVSTAVDGVEALAEIERLRPDIAVIDIGMPNLDGIGLAKKLCEGSCESKVIFMTMYREPKFYDRANELGVKGYVLKDSAANDVIEAVRGVARGGAFVSPSLFDRPVATPPDSPPGIDESGGQLSPAEMRVLELIAQYKTSREIAKALFISPRTVETHRSNICQKVGLQGRHALMKFALTFKKGSDAGALP